MLKIITNPNPILRQKAKPIKDISDKEIKKLIPQLTEALLKYDGVGIAAPQVGYSIRMIAMRYKDDNLTMINPKIAKKSILKEVDEEGCLSVPNVFGEVKRCKKITVKFQDPSGKMRVMTGEGLFARVVQHEVDHLDGILFIDKAKHLRTAAE